MLKWLIRFRLVSATNNPVDERYRHDNLTGRLKDSF